MRIRISRHVYGSDSGYQTLAFSSEITAAEIKELESLSFGQTTDSSYLESLKIYPAYLCRQMTSSGRWAITRIFKGVNDDYGRVTLLFITVLISRSDWLDGIHSDVNLLLLHKKLWEWERENDISEVSIQVSNEDQKPRPQTVRNALSLLSVLEDSTKQQRQTIVVSESIFAQEDIRWLNMILPLDEKEKFSCAVRVLNDNLPSTLICVSKLGSSRKKGGGTIYWEKKVLVDNAPYAHHLSKIWPPESPPPWNFIRSCKSFHPEILSTTKSTTGDTNISTGCSRSEIGHHYEAKTTRVWKRFAVATLIFVFLSIIITLVTHKILTHREISGLLNRIQLFLSKYPDDKFLQLNQEQSESAIIKARILLNESEVLGEVASDKNISKNHATLYIWINDAEKVVQTLKNFHDLVVKYNNRNLPRQPQHYPSPERINKVKTMLEEFEGYEKYPPVLGEEDIAQAKRSIETLETWLSGCGKIMEDLQQRVESIRSNIPPIDNLEGYSKSKHEKYIDAILSLESLHDDNFTNAVRSPIAVDRAKILRDTYNTTRATCERLSGKSFVNRSNAPNFVDKEDKQIEFLKRAKENFDNAHKYWPTRGGIVQDIQTTSIQIKKLISQIDKNISALTTIDDESSN